MEGQSAEYVREKGEREGASARLVSSKFDPGSRQLLGEI